MQLIRPIGLYLQREVLLKPRSLRFQQQRFVVVVISFLSFLLLSFYYAWINDELMVNEKFVTKFHGKITREATS